MKLPLWLILKPLTETLLRIIFFVLQYQPPLAAVKMRRYDVSGEGYWKGFQILSNFLGPNETFPLFFQQGVKYLKK